MGWRISEGVHLRTYNPTETNDVLKRVQGFVRSHPSIEVISSGNLCTGGNRITAVTYEERNLVLKETIEPWNLAWQKTGAVYSVAVVHSLEDDSVVRKFYTALVDVVNEREGRIERALEVREETIE